MASVITWAGIEDELPIDAVEIILPNGWRNASGPWHGSVKYAASEFPQVEIRAFNVAIILSKRGYLIRHYDTRQTREKQRTIKTPLNEWPTVHFGVFGLWQLTLADLATLATALSEAIAVVERLDSLRGDPILNFDDSET